MTETYGYKILDWRINTKKKRRDMKINDVQEQMLRQMLTWDDYSYSTDYFEDILIDGRKVMKPELLKNMRELVKMGVVMMKRGGMNDEGEMVGGTRYYINYETPPIFTKS